MGVWDETAVSDALYETLIAGTYDGNPIRVAFEGGEIVPPSVGIMPPAVPMEANGEDWIVHDFVYSLNLYVKLTQAASPRAAHANLAAFTRAVVETLHENTTLGGAVKGIQPTDPSPVPVQIEQRDRKMLRRTLTFTVYE